MTRIYMPDQVVVKKFGGSMLKSQEDFEEVVANIVQDIGGPKQIIVLSAPYHHTDKLLEESCLLYEGTSDKFRSLLLATGEQVSLSKIGLLLEKQQICTDYLFGYRIPLLTDKQITNTNVESICQKTLFESLEKVDVLLVAGFQGLEREGQYLTTLGRGGSDLTAALLAALLKCPCYFYKDTGGIGQSFEGNFDKIYENLSYEELVELSQSGGRVINDKASLVLSAQQVKTFFGSLEQPHTTRLSKVSSQKIDNITISQRAYRLTCINPVSLLRKSLFRQNFDLLCLNSNENGQSIIAEKKVGCVLDTVTRDALRCLLVGEPKPLSVLHITGSGLLTQTDWYLKVLDHFIAGKIRQVIFNQFKVSIIMDDMREEETMSLARELKKQVALAS